MKSYQDIKLSASGRLDELEETMLSKGEVVNPDMIHTFFPGIYRREIKMDKGMLLTSRIHKTCHPYFVVTGRVTVFSLNDGKDITICAPFMGTTMPGERRALFIHEDCLWVTAHSVPYLTGEENAWDEDRKRELLDRIESELLEEHFSSVSGKDLHLEYQKMVTEKGLKLTF